MITKEAVRNDLAQGLFKLREAIKLLRDTSEPARLNQAPGTVDPRALALAITNAEQAEMWASRAYKGPT